MPQHGINIYDNISLRNVFGGSCRENQNTHFMFNNFFFRKSCRLWNNVEKMWWSQRGHKWQYNMANARYMLDKQGYTRTRPHTEKYVILIAFPRQQWFRERASVLRYTYIACVVSSLKGSSRETAIHRYQSRHPMWLQNRAVWMLTPDRFSNSNTTVLTYTGACLVSSTYDSSILKSPRSGSSVCWSDMSHR
jgi:hypothetical protein